MSVVVRMLLSRHDRRFWILGWSREAGIRLDLAEKIGRILVLRRMREGIVARRVQVAQFIKAERQRRFIIGCFTRLRLLHRSKGQLEAGAS